MAHKVLGQLRKQAEEIEAQVAALLCDTPDPSGAEYAGVRGNPRYLRRLMKSLRKSVDDVTALFPVSAAQDKEDPRYQIRIDEAADEFDEDIDDLDASCTSSSESSVSESSQSESSSSST